jgi:hypothetical protein
MNMMEDNNNHLETFLSDTDSIFMVRIDALGTYPFMLEALFRVTYPTRTFIVVATTIARQGTKKYAKRNSQAQGR